MWLATSSSLTELLLGEVEREDLPGDPQWVCGEEDKEEEEVEEVFGGEKSLEVLGHLARICLTEGRGKMLWKAWMV